MNGSVNSEIYQPTAIWPTSWRIDREQLLINDPFSDCPEWFNQVRLGGVDVLNLNHCGFGADNSVTAFIVEHATSGQFGLHSVEPAEPVHAS